jgi:hypothetical protein
VLVNEAEATPGREVLRHEALQPRRLARAAAADDVAMLPPIGVGDRDGLFV